MTLDIGSNSIHTNTDICIKNCKRMKSELRILKYSYDQVLQDTSMQLQTWVIRICHLRII